MNHAEQALGARHQAFAGFLDQVRVAGRAGRWPEYRLHFGVLRESLLEHMAFAEEEALPALRQEAAGAAKALNETHARLRQHLEVLGAAAPEQDPEGCLAELEEIGALMDSLRTAETALGPEYAARPMPQLTPGRVPAIDLRGLQPPEPIMRIFEALERDPGSPLRVILPHEPVPLYGLLRERGYGYAGAPRADGGYDLMIQRL